MTTNRHEYQDRIISVAKSKYGCKTIYDFDRYTVVVTQSVGDPVIFVEAIQQQQGEYTGPITLIRTTENELPGVLTLILIGVTLSETLAIS